MAMLHDKTKGNDTYDFGEGSTDVDTPTMVDGKPVVTPFTAMASMDSSGGASAKTDMGAGADSKMSGSGAATRGGARPLQEAWCRVKRRSDAPYVSRQHNRPSLI